MFHRMNRPSLQFQLKLLCVLVLHLLLTHSCRGQSQLNGPSQPIVATVGDDIILPCQLQPAEDVAALAVEWTRSDLDPIFVHARRAGQDLTHSTHPSYKDRTSLSIDGLKQGNISLKLSKVKLSDGGKYKCFILQLDKQSFVELVFATEAVSSPVISLAGIDRDRGGVMLQCESKGWHPQPEVFWLDGEGNLLSAGPTETVRGPDYLYTVSSTVTVEKSHSNNFTCRVQNINQIRETYIIVADDLFKAQPSSSSVIIGLAVSLTVCIVFIVAGKTKRSCMDETEGGGNKKLSKSDDPEMQPLNAAETDGANLTQHKEEAERLRAELEIKNKKVENKQAECDLLMKLQQLHEENQRTMRDLQTLKKNLETKTKELEKMKAVMFSPVSTREKKAAKEQEVETLKKELQIKQEEFETKTKEIEEIKAELQKLRDENQRKETDLQRQTEETNNEEFNRDQTASVRSKALLLEEKQAELLKEKQDREKEVKDLKNQLESNQKQIDAKQDEVQKLQEENQKLQEENQKLQEENQKLQTDLNTKTTEIETLQDQLQKSEKQLKVHYEKVENKQAECDLLMKMLQLLEENQRTMRDLQTLKEYLETKTKELETMKGGLLSLMFSDEEEQQRKEQTEKEVETLKKKLQTKQEEFETKTKEIEEIKAELQQLHDENQRKETDLQRQTEETNNKETQPASQHNSTEVFVEFDPYGKRIFLTNGCKEDLKLEGWRLRVTLNDENPIMYTFEESFKLRAEKSVTIWASGCTPPFPGPYNLKWEELKCWDKGDKLLVELIKCHEEIVKTTETQGASKHDDTNPAGKNSTERPGASQHNDTNPADQNSTEVLVEIDPNGKYVRLINKSKEDLKLEGWRLRMTVNDENPIMFTFEKSIILKAERRVCIWAQGFGTNNPPSDLRWKDLKCWTREDKLLVELINCDEEIVTTIEGDKSLHGENSHSDPISPHSGLRCYHESENRSDFKGQSVNPEDFRIEQ